RSSSSPGVGEGLMATEGGTGTNRGQAVAGDRRKSRMSRVWKVWLGVAAALTIAYFVAPNTPGSKLVLYNGTGFLAVCAIVYGIHRNRPATSAPWWWFAGGLASFLTGDICYYVLEIRNPNGPPFPSIADVFY